MKKRKQNKNNMSKMINVFFLLHRVAGSLFPLITTTKVGTNFYEDPVMGSELGKFEDCL